MVRLDYLIRTLINLKTTLKRMKLSACLVKLATNELTSAASEAQLKWSIFLLKLDQF